MAAEENSYLKEVPFKDRCVFCEEYDTMDWKPMNIAKRLAIYEDKGFSRERAEINVLMEAGAGAIFRDFPEAFVLFGGATLVLYHDSVRHSADLDLLWRGSDAPSREEVAACLKRDLTPLAEIVGLGALTFEFQNLAGREARIYVNATGRQLFRV